MRACTPHPGELLDRLESLLPRRYVDREDPPTAVEAGGIGKVLGTDVGLTSGSPRSALDVSILHH